MYLMMLSASLVHSGELQIASPVWQTLYNSREPGWGLDERSVG